MLMVVLPSKVRFDIRMDIISVALLKNFFAVFFGIHVKTM